MIGLSMVRFAMKELIVLLVTLGLQTISSIFEMQGHLGVSKVGVGGREKSSVGQLEGYFLNKGWEVLGNIQGKGVWLTAAIFKIIST